MKETTNEPAEASSEAVAAEHAPRAGSHVPPWPAEWPRAKPLYPERSSIDDVIDVYKRDVDWTLIELQLKKTPEQRSRDLQSFHDSVMSMRQALDRSGR